MRSCHDYAPVVQPYACACVHASSHVRPGGYAAHVCHVNALLVSVYASSPLQCAHACTVRVRECVHVNPYRFVICMRA